MISDPQRQTAYLVALTTLIKSVPKTMYMHELPSVRHLSIRDSLNVLRTKSS